MDSPSLTMAIAMGSGVLASALAHHLRLPGIVLFLTLGVVLGPDVANVVRPEALGEGLNAFVGFAVAIILFEGGLHMNLKKLRAQAKPIRGLVTIGALVTAAGAALVTKFVMDWEWRLSVLFGTLVIVTGPTVITPLLRRLRVKPNVSMILEAEGIFIDAVGATIAVVALNIVLSENAAGALGLFSKIGVGVGVGLAGGLVLALLLWRRRVIPEGLENIVGLGLAVLVYQVSHAIEHESGITAAIVAGMVVSNTQSHAFEGLVEFKEQLVALLIATLFVLLSADVRVADVLALGVPGLVTVGLLMFVVRPLTVAASTWKTDLDIKEKAFLSWLAPRGIVAAAVASLFAAQLARNGVAGGVEMKALVFLVIAVTVTVQGLSGGVIARLLGLKRAANYGYAILGANPLARALARQLQRPGGPVVLIDSDLEACKAAQREGFEAIHGNGLEAKTLDVAMVDARKAVIALTATENVNFLFAKKVKEHFRGAVTYVALESEESGVTAKMLENTDFHLLFGSEGHLALWQSYLRRDLVDVETWELTEAPKTQPELMSVANERVLPLVVQHGTKVWPVGQPTDLKAGDRVVVAIVRSGREEANRWLHDQGFEPCEGKVIAAADAPSDGH